MPKYKQNKITLPNLQRLAARDAALQKDHFRSEGFETFQTVDLGVTKQVAPELQIHCSQSPNIPKSSPMSLTSFFVRCSIVVAAGADGSGDSDGGDGGGR